MAVAVEEGEEEVDQAAVVRSWAGWMISEGRSARAVSDEDTGGALDRILALWTRGLEGSTGVVQGLVERLYAKNETESMKVCELHGITIFSNQQVIAQQRLSKDSIFARAAGSLAI